METKQAVDKNELLIFRASLLLIAYFGFLFLNTYVLKFDYTLIGVFQEILTIPLMLFTLLLLFFSVRNFVSNRYVLKSYAFLSTILLMSVVAITFGSFFLN
jgi:hypothetical protein